MTAPAVAEATVGATSDGRRREPRSPGSGSHHAVWAPPRDTGPVRARRPVATPRTATARSTVIQAVSSSVDGGAPARSRPWLRASAATIATVTARVRTTV